MKLAILIFGVIRYDKIRSDKILRQEKIIFYSSPEGNYSVAQSNKNIVKEYKANTDESNTTNLYPPITHPHTYTLKLMHTVQLYQHYH